ncbi:RING finger protein 10 [Amborella trichopoda]|uniref:RING-type domain-containing protein n=1 Tax=Amborella trichopoda TaxID=13333 RepID=W1PDZ2_AMBTC|nr:RING finger protein 10 [Amborella trichopoda]ERN06158.1 hypothetical protein AMTR_s00016p00109400 [Amborella trichopoda]|eukprot:XP_006844483.1 RING finger protein 10 [Amborella trichopoda]
MSILPTNAKVSSPPFNKASSENPNFDHGISENPGVEPSAFYGQAESSGSAQISNQERIDNGSSSSLVGTQSDSFASPGRVMNGRSPDALNGPHGHSHDMSSSCNTFSHRESSSTFRCEQLNGRSSGAGPQHIDKSSSGAGTHQGNAIHSVSRKNQTVNANHLLNFHYDPISRPQTRMPPPRRQQKIKPYNKDLFLQANYKFVVVDTGNSALKSKDPDKMLQWEDVVCVRYSTPFSVQCPICLEDPLCPQITTCGHIFCFPCILRYLLMGVEDHKGDCWKKCPLCFMKISSKDLYTVYVDYVKQYHIGDHIDFTLLTRPKDSMIPFQKNHHCVNAVPYTNDGLCDLFSKFTLTLDIGLSFQEAKLELNQWLVKAESGGVDDLDKLPYVCAALEQLEQREKFWTEHRPLSSSPPQNQMASSSNPGTYRYTPQKTQSHATIPTLSDGNDFKAGDHAGKILHTGHKDELSESDSLPLTEANGDKSSILFGDVPLASESEEKGIGSYDEDKGFHRHSDGHKNNSEKDSYTFYQSEDGQLLVPHPLNMKCLLRYYGSYDLLPSRISGKILELETVTLSEVMRRRFRFLSHLSLTTTFQLCEINLHSILPPDAFTPFMDEIKTRENQRKRQAKQLEKQARAKAAEAVPVTSHFQHSSYNETTFSMDDFEALGSSAALSTSPPVVGGRKLFSQVARFGFASGHDSPSLRLGDSSGVSTNHTEDNLSTQTGSGNTTMQSFAGIIASSAKPATLEVPKVNALRKKGKKQTRVLLSTAGDRRY